MTVFDLVALCAGGLWIFGFFVLFLDFVCMSFLHFSLQEKLPDAALTTYKYLWYGILAIIAIFLIAEFLTRAANFEF